MDSITLIPAAIIIALVAVIGAGAMAFAYKLEAAETPDGTKPKPRPTRLLPGAILIAIAIIAGAWLMASVTIALDHGMYDAHLPVTQMAYANANSFSDQSDKWTGPQSMSGKIVIMYRYACEDCEATAHSIEAALNADDIEHIWVSSRSEKGREIRERYNIGEVPCYLTFSPDGVALTKQACDIDENDSPIMDRDAYQEVRDFVKGR